MSDDIFGEFDKMMADKKDAAQKAAIEADKKAAAAQAQSEINAKLIATEIRPAIEEVMTGLIERDVACKIEEGGSHSNTISLVFNPNGELNPIQGKNAHVRFSLGSSKGVSIHEQTMFDGGSGHSGDGANFPSDGDLPDRVKKAIMKVVMQAMQYSPAR